MQLIENVKWERNIRIECFGKNFVAELREMLVAQFNFKTLILFGTALIMNVKKQQFILLFSVCNNLNTN